MKRKLLFVCTGNRDRSPTAEAVFKQHPSLETRSAGTSRYANTPLTEGLLGWADVVVVMERCHEAYIRESYPDVAAGKPLFLLEIPDQYRFMDAALVAVIRERMTPVLGQCLDT